MLCVSVCQFVKGFGIFSQEFFLCETKARPLVPKPIVTWNNPTTTPKFSNNRHSTWRGWKTGGIRDARSWVDVVVSNVACSNIHPSTCGVNQTTFVCVHHHFCTVTLPG